MHTAAPYLPNRLVGVEHIQNVTASLGLEAMITEAVIRFTR